MLFRLWDTIRRASWRDTLGSCYNCFFQHNLQPRVLQGSFPSIPTCTSLETLYFWCDTPWLKKVKMLTSISVNPKN
ncbi:hypothetical protein JD844_005913 [Phrynosoma platyrhinos]|uniref:Uncharacterized protein n=1 Tax=Phrynosoma platyrhinos TaxID=52577 RepID=A0ABQ7TP08_PHRPL|nr:hypothetical protein JD844_005913 [Phrynosoma platyrhinos]